MNKKYSDTIGMYDDVVHAFNSGDPFTKIAQTFGANKDTLRQVIDFYEKTTGNKIAPIVAGRSLAQEKNAAFGFLNPRQWVDFFISPEKQAQVVTKIGKATKAKSFNAGAVPKTANPLLEEAKKYKSADEFVNQKTFNISIDDLTPTNPDALENFKKGGRSRSPFEPLQVILKDGKIQILNGNHRYYEALSMGKKELPVSFITEPIPSATNVKSQLTDLYNQAHGKTKAKK